MTSPAPWRIPPDGSVVAVVDDEPLVRSATSSLLRSLGYSCWTFETAERLLASDLVTIDCILSDIQMPTMSGIELVRQVRARSTEVPIILMSGYHNELADDLQRGGEIVTMLDKPLDGDLLQNAVAIALDRRAAGQRRG